MFDTHYDLLTILYCAYLDNNYDKVEEIITNFNKNNIKGLFASLYFMKKDEMKNELGNLYYRDYVKVERMFDISVSLFKKYFDNTEVIFTIEGCDYIDDESSLDTLYELGLRNILLVWNNKNKYASGNATNDGITDKGIKFIKKAIELGIIIDFSHTNERTFNDIYNICKEYVNNGKKVYTVASHSNCRSLCDNKRNLSDDQLKKLKEIGTYIGLVSYDKFITNNTDLDIKDIRNEYIKHIIHVKDIYGDCNHIMLSSDNMTFMNDDNYFETFDFNLMNKQIRQYMKNNFNDEEINNICYLNANRLYNEVK